MHMPYPYPTPVTQPIPSPYPYPYPGPVTLPVSDVTLAAVPYPVSQGPDSWLVVLLVCGILALIGIILYLYARLRSLPVRPARSKMQSNRTSVQLNLRLKPGERVQVLLEAFPDAPAAYQMQEHSGTGAAVALEISSPENTLRLSDDLAQEQPAAPDVKAGIDDPVDRDKAIEAAEPASLLDIVPAPVAVTTPATLSRLDLILISAAGLGMTLLGQWLVRHEFSRLRSFGLVPLGLGVVFLFLAVYGVRQKRLPDWLGRFSRRLESLSGMAAGKQVLLLVGPLLAYTASLAAGDGGKMAEPILAVAAWLMSIGLILVSAWQSTRPGLKLSWQVILTAGLILIFALVTRLYNVARIPIALTGDEGNMALSAMNFIKGETDNIFVLGWHGFPSLYYFFQSLFIRIGGNTIEALRVPAGVVGALSVVSIFFLARTFYGNRVALFVGILAAAFHYHIHFSRIGLNNIWDAWLYVVALGLLWYGWDREKRSAILLAGLGMGLAQYFYMASRMLPVIALAWLVLVGLLNRSRLKRLLPDLILMWLVTLVVVMPLVVFYSHHLDDFWGPLRGNSIFGPWLANEAANTQQPAWLIVLRQAWKGFAAYTFIDLNAWYHPGTSLLRTGQALFFLLGLIQMLTQWRDSRTLLVGFWLIGGALTGGFSESTPAAQRYVAAAPACSLVVAYGVNLVLVWLEEFWSERKRLFQAAAIILVFTLAADDLRFYFYEYTPQSYWEGKYDFTGYGSAVAQYLIEDLKDEPADWKVYFFGSPVMGYYSINSLPYLVPQIEGVDLNYPWRSTQNPPVEEQDKLIFVFLPGHETDLQGVREDYPGGYFYRQYYRNGSMLYSVYRYSKTENNP